MIRVLYVDDEVSLLDVCREFIEVPGQIAMETALSAKEAFSALSRSDFDVVVSDYQMPDINGIELLKRLRSEFGHVPFILFTGRGREEVAIEALNSGADFYLQKGGDPSVQYGQLQKAIIHLAKSYETERSLIISQRRYSDLVERAKAIAVKVDQEMRITYVNPYGLRQLGWGDGLVGSNFAEWLEMARVEKSEPSRQTLDAMFAHREKGETFMHSFRTKDGEQRWVAWTCRFIRNDRGTGDEFLLFGTDITDAKRSESKLQRSMSLIKAAFDSTEEGMMVTSKDRKVTEYNQRFLDMWNVSQGMMESSSREDLLAFVGKQFSSPETFLPLIDDINAHPLQERRFVVELNDGRKYEGATKPVMLGTEVEGRFWSFRDVPQQSVMEREFKLREENMLGLVDNNKANMMIIDPSSGEIVYANKAAIDFYGYSGDRLTKMRLADITTMARERVAEELLLACNEKKQYFIFQHRLASGELRDVEVFCGPIEFEGRSLLFTLVHDISEMERTKRSVVESELRHNHVLNSLAIGIFVTDPSGRLVYTNRTVQELLRRTPDEMLGRSPIDMMAEEHRELGRSNLASRNKGGEGKVDYCFIRGDGTPVWVQTTVVPIFDKQVYSGTIASLVDISEQREDALMIRESEKKFRDIFNNMHDAVLIHEPGGKFYEVNDVACERFGYTREELLTMGPENLDTPDSISGVPEKTKNLMEKGSAIFESTHVTKDGRKIPTEINAIVIDRDRRPSILVVCRDITERKIADERLERATEKLKILNSITRHDIMNQLMVLQGNLEIVMSRENDRAVSERMNKVARSAETIGSQLLFAKDYQEMGTTTPQWQNIGQLIARLPDVKELSDLEVDRSLDRLEVYADPMLVKVFHNIMEDSLKYADRPVKVRIGCRKGKKSLVLVYEDEGQGIPFAEKAKIFDMGFGRGTGLGLHLSMEILSITDIRISETGEPGKGVRFEMEVPEGRYRFAKG